jgi:Protein of unknown function (DUF2892)
MWRTMFYPKNVPNVERIARIALGIVLIGLVLIGHTAVPGLLLFTAGFVVVTGFVGWCPACALIGRKIKRNPRQIS